LEAQHSRLVAIDANLHVDILTIIASHCAKNKIERKSKPLAEIPLILIFVIIRSIFVSCLNKVYESLLMPG
jgi:hypothetical protein